MNWVPKSCIIGLLLILASCTSSTKETAADKYLEDARAAWNEKDYGLWFELVKHATTQASISDADRTMLTLELGKGIATRGTTQALEPDVLELARNDLQLVRETGTSNQQVEATKFLALLYLTQSDNSNAIETYGELPFDKLKPKDAANCRYNFGRAYERTNQSQKAYEQYLLALKSDKKLKEAREAIQRVTIWTTPEAAVKQAAEMTRNGALDAAEEHLYTAYAHWRNDSGGPVCLAGIADYYVAARITPEEFKQDHEGRLKRLDDGSEKLGTMTDAIRDAFNERKLKPSFHFQSSELDRHFQVWALSPQAPAMSRLLKYLGDWFGLKNDLNSSLARYALAWQVDRTNIEAAIYAAGILRNNLDQLDPSHRLLQDFIREAFDEKMSILNQIRGRRQPADDDYLHLVQLHLILADLLWKENAPADSPYLTSEFHWNEALRMEKMGRDASPQFRPVPQLHERFAEYLHAKESWSASLEQYLVAAEEYHEVGDQNSQDRLVQMLQASKNDLTSEEQRRLVLLAASNRLDNSPSSTAPSGG
jgi:hypothetical protein